MKTAKTTWKPKEQQRHLFHNIKRNQKLLTKRYLASGVKVLTIVKYKHEGGAVAW